MSKKERLQRQADLEKLFTAVDDYCTKSANGKQPISDMYWLRVVAAWERCRDKSIDKATDSD